MPPKEVHSDEVALGGIAQFNVINGRAVAREELPPGIDRAVLRRLKRLGVLTEVEGVNEETGTPTKGYISTAVLAEALKNESSLDHNRRPAEGQGKGISE